MLFVLNTHSVRISHTRRRILEDEPQRKVKPKVKVNKVIVSSFLYKQCLGSQVPFLKGKTILSTQLSGGLVWGQVKKYLVNTMNPEIP